MLEPTALALVSNVALRDQEVSFRNAAPDSVAWSVREQPRAAAVRLSAFDGGAAALSDKPRPPLRILTQ